MSEKVNSSEYEKIKCRTFDVTDVVKLWGEEISPQAVYIADTELVNGDVVFAGTVVLQTEYVTGCGNFSKLYFGFGVGAL